MVSPPDAGAISDDGQNPAMSDESSVVVVAVVLAVSCFVLNSEYGD